MHETHGEQHQLCLDLELGACDRLELKTRPPFLVPIGFE
jgi:hypothetical protein